MYIIDAQVHPIGVMDIDCYSPDRAAEYPPPSLEELPNPHGGSPMGPRDWYVDDLIEAMDAFDVRKSVVMCGGVQVTNDNLAAAVRQHPDRFVGFSGYEHFQPNSLDDATTKRAVDAMARGIDQFGFKGIGEIHPDRFSPVEPSRLYVELRPIMDVCSAKRVPVYFHTGLDVVTFRVERRGEEGSSWSYHPSPLPYRDPTYLDAVALEYPDVPIMIGHIGGKTRPLFEAALMLARRHKNVYLTTPNTLPEFIEEAVRAVVAERLIWGSDWAWRSVKGPAPTKDLGHGPNLAVLKQANLTEAQNEAILGRNIAELIGIALD
jgi:predicted TIM-barrel fold metal-dependent hydrolase